MRLVLVHIPSEYLADLCRTRGSETISIEGVPVDAEFMSVHYSDDCRSVLVTFKHESFEDIPDGERIPRFTPTLTKHENWDVEDWILKYEDEINSGINDFGELKDALKRIKASRQEEEES